MEVQLPLPGEKRFNPPVGSSKKSNTGTFPEPRSICIFRLSSIGDVIHTIPVVDLLKKRYPAATITWVAEKAMSPLLKNHPNIDQLLLVDTRGWRKHPFTPGVWKEILGFLRYLRDQSFDVALDFQGLFKSAVLARISGAPRRVGMSETDRKERWSSFLLNEFCAQTADKKHIIEKNLALLEELDIHSENEPWNFHITPDPEAVYYVENELQKLELDRFVLINPGAGWITKQWEPDKFAILIDGIYNSLNIPALISWGPGEKQLADKIARKCISPAFASFSTNLSELIALSTHARLMVSGDSGPLHLASALGIPVVGLYGPTDPDRNGPWNPQDSTCTVHYECSPCWQRTCPIGIQCMKKIEVDPVLDSVKRTYYLTASLWQNQ
jgi:lipopolysaccharide heptosyltransferase I